MKKINKTGAQKIVSYLTDKLNEFETGRKYWESQYNEVTEEKLKATAHRNIMHFMANISELQSMILQLTLDYKLSN